MKVRIKNSNGNLRRFPNLHITAKDVEGTYKGRIFSIFLFEKGNAYYREGENRYNIDVYDLKSGMHDVFTYETCENIEKALIYALKGAML